MDEQYIRATLTQVLRTVLQDSALELSDDMTGWDSITYINIIVGVERAFAITFSTREIHRLTSVREFVQALIAKGPSLAASPEAAER